jgi:hypothetical protein
MSEALTSKGAKAYSPVLSNCESLNVTATLISEEKLPILLYNITGKSVSL